MICRFNRVVVMVVLLLLVVAGLLSPRYGTASWLAYRQYEGTLNGRPVLLDMPELSNGFVPAEYEIQMSDGVCELARVERNGSVIRYCTVGRAYGTLQSLPAGSRLRLEPGAGAGTYVVRVGSKYHILSPFLWRLLAIVALIGLALFPAARNLWKRKAQWQPAFTPWQWATVAALVALTGLVLYPALHEAGHALVGQTMGAEVKSVILTPLSGQQPQVCFGSMPERAIAWHCAAAVFLPILVAYALLLTWLLLKSRLASFAQAAILAPSVFLLFASFGFDDHLRPLAERFGWSTAAGVTLVKLIPVLLSLGAYAFVGILIRRQVRKAASATGCMR